MLVSEQQPSSRPCVQEISELEPIEKAKVIDVEGAGLEVDFKKASVFEIPEEFQQELDENPESKTRIQDIDSRTAEGVPFICTGETIKKPEFKG